MERENYSLHALYRKSDKNEDGSISLVEFKKLLEKTVEVYLKNDKLLEKVFDRFDLDHDNKISFQEFEDSIYGSKRIKLEDI